MPGEIEAEHKRRVEKEGLVLGDAHIERMQEVCRMLGMSMEDVFLD